MIRILDGGMGQEIFRRLGQPETGWVPLAAVDHFDVVRTLHEEYLAAGAQIITTDTYNLGRFKMNKAGLWDRFAEANEAAARAAEAAREARAPGALIAGAIGPVRGSYQPDAVPPPETIEREVVEQALVLAPHVDLLLVETMTTAAEARAAATAAKTTGKPVWVGLTLHEMGPAVLRSGEPIGEATKALAGLADVILLNCTSPEAVDKGMAELAVWSSVPVGAYANAFTPIPPEYGHGMSVNHLGRRDDVTPERYAEHARRWVSAGATVVGGCCEVTPAHIAHLSETLAQR